MADGIPAVDLNPATLVSRRTKEKHIAALSEAEFRDKVIVPIFERRGLHFLRDTCGPTEEGKDCLFLDTDRLGRPAVYAIQTKKGPLNLTGNPKANIQVAVTQLQTALNTPVTVDARSAKLRPLKVYLCASGKINESGRRHIQEAINDPRLEFYDVNNVISDLDELYPEFWYGIDADRFPYLRSLQEELLRASDTIAISDLGVGAGHYAPITNESFVPLHAVRFTSDPKKVSSPLKNLLPGMG